MVGVPAKQIGWVGVSGNTLEFKANKAVDKADGKIYAIIDENLEEKSS